MIMNRFLLLKKFSIILIGFIGIMTFAQNGGGDNTNLTCAQAIPVCPDNNFGVNVPNVTGSSTAEEGPYYGCLSSQPRPMWYYMRVAQSGYAIFDLNQYSQPDQQGTGLDVDFALWGPFESQNACNELTQENMIDCSYHPRAFEIVDFTGGTSTSAPPIDGPFDPGWVNEGEYYILLVTNYNGGAGYVNLSPRYPDMTAVFDCSILGPVYSFCDYEGDGQEEVELDNYINDINDGNPNIGVTFHATSSGAYNYEDILDSNQTLTMEPLTVYARKEDFTTGQVEVVIITFNLIPEPEMQEDSLSFCDNNGDGLEIFDLTVANVNADPEQELILSYYTSQEDADNAENAIEDPTYYQSGTATIYVRGDVGDCYATTLLHLEVLDGITLNPVEITVCDEDGDGVETFNLNDYASEILGTYQGEVRFYLNESDAIAWNDNYITNTEDYTTDSVVLYAAASTEGDCQATTTVSIEVLPAPIVSNVMLPYQYCDLYNDNSEIIDLTIAFADVIDDTTGFTATYYLNENDAEAGNDNFIPNPSSFDLTGTVNVYIRVSAGECSSVAMVIFELTDGIPVTDATLLVCYNENGQGNFDLTEANVSNIGTYTYHTSEAAAMSGNNAINNPTNYTGNVPSTIYVRVEDEDCVSIAEITLDYFQQPDINIPVEFAICSGYSEIVDAGGGFISYAWSTGETSQSIEVSELGSYWVDLTDANGCTFRHDFEVIPGTAPIIAHVEVGQDSFTITAEGGQEPYEYSIGGFIFQDSNILANLPQGTYNIFVRGADGCVSEVEIASILSWPTMFTPNGDGINDTFRVPGLEVYPGSMIRIFDRHGMLVHQGNVNSNVLWDGSDLSGNKVSTQDYWYILEVSDGRKYTGHVTVKNRTEKGR